MASKLKWQELEIPGFIIFPIWKYLAISYPQSGSTWLHHIPSLKVPGYIVSPVLKYLATSYPQSGSTWLHCIYNLKSESDDHGCLIPSYRPASQPGNGTTHSGQVFTPQLNIFSHRGTQRPIFLGILESEPFYRSTVYSEVRLGLLVQ